MSTTLVGHVLDDPTAPELQHQRVHLELRRRLRAGGVQRVDTPHDGRDPLQRVPVLGAMSR